MAEKICLRLACVPEQVNIPINYLAELGIAESHNIDLNVLFVPEGTGKMLEMLEKNEADIALTVTDAFIVASSHGRAVQLAGVWVNSPLVWAIAASSSLPDSVTSLCGLIEHRQQKLQCTNVKLRVGISRLGSGSQTMASYMSMIHNLDFKNGLEFVVANNISGLIKGIQQDLFDIFLWETFTTKPYFDKNELRKIGDVPTPWPAFSLVTRKDDEHNLKVIMKERLFPALFEASQVFAAKDHEEESINKIVSKLGHQRADAASWLSKVVYNTEATMAIEPQILGKAVNVLKQVELVEEDFITEDLWKENLDIATVHVCT